MPSQEQILLEDQMHLSLCSDHPSTVTEPFGSMTFLTDTLQATPDRLIQVHLPFRPKSGISQYSQV